jgi:hypothetical protein
MCYKGLLLRENDGFNPVFVDAILILLNGIFQNGIYRIRRQVTQSPRYETSSQPQQDVTL